MLQEFIDHYGYLAIFIGTFLEGETILALGGFAAQQGMLDLKLVMVSAFFGSLFGDQLYFFIGRIYGAKILLKRPKWLLKKERFDRFFHRYHTPSILIFRFLYGLRTVAPFAIGMSSISTPKFVFLNIVGAFVWAIGLGYLGYLFGDGIELILDDIKKYQTYLLVGIVVFAVLFWLYRRFIKKTD